MSVAEIVCYIDKNFNLFKYELYDKEADGRLKQFLERGLNQCAKDYFEINFDDKSGRIEINDFYFKYQIIQTNFGTKGADEKQYILLFSRDGIQKEIYEVALDSLPEGVQIYNNNGYGLFINRISEQIGEMKRGHFIGNHLLDLYDVREDYSTVLTTLREKKPIVNRCDRFKAGNGKMITTVNSAFPVERDGELFGAVLLENDISTIKQQAYKNIYLEDYVLNQGSIKRESKYYQFSDIIHRSKPMEEAIHFAKKVSLTESSVLIYGETGTGKELLAQSMHSFGKRRDKPFIAVNCGAVPLALAESLFFGTVKGAYTGSRDHVGFFEQAHGGTLFLDEVNSMSLDMQSKLLRVLQEKKFRKIGGAKYYDCDVRIIATSNENLFDLIEKNRIRKDFFYRISTIIVDLPRLGERPEDIEILSEFFIGKLNKKYGKNINGVSKEVMKAFEGYDWPGNIRELQHIIEYSFNITHESDTLITIEHLPRYLNFDLPTFAIKHEDTNLNHSSDSLIEILEEYEKKVIEKYLKKYNGNITKTAKILDLRRQSLQYRMKKYKIELK
ncbi:sigma 54-interacting transcriptional regulator [Wukongibacter baidiensis]|uniref:sigma-54 interaction domain-containing protein n=1 Tax=Wukongibacter baidiensis TaxID=1723361 RepID=UPI003D7FD01E